MLQALIAIVTSTIPVPVSAAVHGPTPSSSGRPAAAVSPFAAPPEIATAGCPSNCGTRCGSHNASCGWAQGGRCSPFPVLPNVQDQGCRAWEDRGRFSTSSFFRESSPRSYQAWQSAGSSDTWVAHGCDGAGIQTDCFGDVMYFEHFDQPSPAPAPPCSSEPYPSHRACSFTHPGKPSGAASFGQYQCGWWRGYKSANAANLQNSPGRGAAYDAGLFGAAGAGADYSKLLADVLDNCPSCRTSTKSALQTPFTDAKAFFTGALWPWVCSEADDAAYEPYTGSKYMNCYCDNEPHNGRQPSGGKPVFPYESMFVYCGLYEDGSGDLLTCDLITLEPNGGEQPTNATVYASSFVLRPAAF